MNKYTDVFKSLPETIQSLLDLLIKEALPSEVILFGSRARGDCRPNSDFDIVFTFANEPHSDKWAKVRGLVEDNTETLHKIDLLRWSELNTDYQKNIKKDGKILYG